MTKYIVQGGHPLFGEVRISGAKNAAVAIIPAALLVDGVCRIENIPQISDVTALLKILEQLGANVRFLNRSDVEIDCRRIATTQVSQELAHKIRASYYLIGALLGRFGEAEVSMPGGCNFGGVRPIDQHVKGFAAMGAEVREGDFICAKASGGRMKGANVYLDVVSVGATMNIMMAAALADGTTVIENAAKEPHIVDLANFLNSMGANIKGAGTDTIRIFGVDKLHGGTYAIIPDQIEAGTYLAAVTAAGGNVLVQNVIPKHLECITGKLQDLGARIIPFDDSIRIIRSAPLRPSTAKTSPYPGFPTDMQAQVCVCMALANGTSRLTESVYETRFFGYCTELESMGANISITNKTATVIGVRQLHGATVSAHDLRAGAALVIAGLAAQGITHVRNIHFVERGYEDLIGKLTALGAGIKRIEG